MGRLNNKGFTLIELVLVIALLGILAIAAIPQFINVSTQAAQAARDGVAGAVKSGISLQRANTLVTTGTATPPAALDGVTNGNTCSATNLCFSTVVDGGVDDGRWSKNATGGYVYASGAVSSTFTYTAATGVFTCASGC